LVIYNDRKGNVSAVHNMKSCTIGTDKGSLILNLALDGGEVKGNFIMRSSELFL
jgi:hypothetical protein